VEAGVLYIGKCRSTTRRRRKNSPPLVPPTTRSTFYHTKCNLKTAIDGSVWAWHQDFGTWKRDGVQRPRLTTALIMLDEPTELNGCLYFIPGSHKEGNLEPVFELDPVFIDVAFDSVLATSRPTSSEVR